MIGEQGWRSGESARLPPMCPRFDSQTRRHMWVEFAVGSCPCSGGFSLGSPVFLPPQKSTFLNSIGNSRAMGLSVSDCYVLPSLNKVNYYYYYYYYYYYCYYYYYYYYRYYYCYYYYYFIIILLLLLLLILLSLLLLLLLLVSKSSKKGITTDQGVPVVPRWRPKKKKKDGIQTLKSSGIIENHRTYM